MLSFTNIRPESLTAGNWRIDGGTALDPATASTLTYSNNGLSSNTAQSGSWAITLASLDLLGDGGTYDVDVSVSLNGFNAQFNSSNQRFLVNYNTSTDNDTNPANASTITFSDVQISISNATGSSDMVDASNLESTFLGFTEVRVVSIGAADGAELTGVAVGGGAITPQSVNRTVTGGSSRDNFAFSAPAEEFTFGAIEGGSVALRNFDGSFQIVPVPEPSAVLMVGVGSVLLLVRRRRGGGVNE